MSAAEDRTTSRTTAVSNRLEPASASFWDRYFSASSSTRQVLRLPYVPALDGIRALAVLAVLLYHAGYRWIPGGFLGVEIFFVLSGYLITSLLLVEWRGTGQIDLKTFWLRRARRLLPALYLLLVATLAYAVFKLPGEVAQLRADAAAAFFYVTNWWLIFDHTSYFVAMGRPSLFQHLWSLAVEEQFYLIWPPLFALGIARIRERRLLLGVVLGVIASTTLMALLYQPAVDPSRLYYGTDTRAAELLAGVALAFVWQPRQSVRWGNRAGKVVSRLVGTGRRAAILLDVVGALALAGLGVAMWRLGEYSPSLYRGGFLLVALLTIALIAVVVHGGARVVSALLGCAPLRWTGTRSYGIYLWHWPIYMVTRPGFDVPLNGLPLLGLRVILTLTAVEISYRYVETPFRSGTVGSAWRSFRLGTTSRPRMVRVMWYGLSSTVAMSTVLLGFMVARARPADPPPYLQVQEVHITASPTASSAPTTVVATPTPSTPSVATGAPGATNVTSAGLVIVTPPATTGPTATPSRPGTPAETPSPTPTPEPTVIPTPTPTVEPQVASAPSVTAVGDSVMVGAARDLAADIPNLDLDAKVGMQVTEAIQILQARLDAGDLGEDVVVDIGNNGPMTRDEFDWIMQIAGSDRRVVFLSVRVPRAWEGTNNQVLSDGVARYDNAFMVDWYGATVNRPELFWDDGIHLRPEGADLYARMIAAEIEPST